MEKKVEQTIEQLIYEETCQRLKEMGSKEYKFPQRADKTDAIGIVAALGISSILILLCMTGVIV